MNLTDYYVAVDLGATSGRVIVGNFDGTEVKPREIHRFAHPMLPIAGHLFWNLPGLYHEILLGLRKAGEHAKENGGKVRSIGIDTWGCDVAMFHADGSLSSLPYCYRDPHTAGAADKMCARIPRDELYGLTGIQFMDFNTLFQLFTMHLGDYPAIRNCSRILFIPDAIGYMLTGRAVTEYTVASTSQMLNPYIKGLDTKLLEAVGLAESHFGEMVNPGHVLGELNENVKKFTGLEDAQVVAVAGHDTASAIIGVPAQVENYAYLSCGTWSLLGIETPVPIINEKAYKYNFTNEGGIDGTTRFLKNITGMWIFEQVRGELPDAPADTGAMCALYDESDIESIINPDDPSFAAPSSMKEAIDDYCRRTGQSIPETAADYVHVIFRSLALRCREVMGMLLEMSPHPIEMLHVIGGGSRNARFMQLLADTLGIPVVAGPTESTALGNLLVQLRAAGLVSDLREMRKISANSTTTITYLPR